jgi:hypothetical protein
MTKGARQPHPAISATTSGGVNAAPKREPPCVTPWAKPRSDGSIQRESERVAIGNAPASPTPNRKRNIAIDAAFQAAAVSAVNALHHVTMRASARRGPMRSPNQPPGIWNSAYPQRNDARIQPIVSISSPNSSRMAGTAEAITTRSM